MKTAVVMVSICLSALMSEAQPSGERVADSGLGRREWPAVSNGLVFVEGEFLPPPYVVSRIGSGIYINGRHIESPLPCPSESEACANSNKHCKPNHSGSNHKAHDTI